MSGGGKDTLKLRSQGLFVFITFIAVTSSAEKKIRYTSSTECDRYSLDAVYHEKFKIITDNVFEDTIEFVRRVSDSISESLTSIMAQLPDRAASDKQEKKIFHQFKAVRDTFSSRIKKFKRNIISKWESLIAGHFDLMFDNGKSSLDDYVNRTRNMTDAYGESRKSLDASMESFIGFMKSTVRDGIQGISAAATDALKRERTEKGKEVVNEEEQLMRKKLEIAEMVANGFLGQVTIEVIKRNIDLFKKVDLRPDERESVLDDLEFDILMIKNRILAILQPDLPKDKGSVDLARRSIYTYWADMAADMYKEKIKSKKSTEPKGDQYYRKLWSDDLVLMNTLLNLMEVYG